MSNTNKVGNTLSRIITYVLVVLLVLGMAGFIVYLAAKEEGISLYVEYNGERYFSGISGGELGLIPGEEHRFSVKSISGDNADYAVSVTANGQNNFTYVYGGEFYDFYISDDAAYNDYSSVFGLEKGEEGFSVTIPAGFDVEGAVEAKRGGDVQLQDKLQDNVPYFVITVTSGGNALSLLFTFGSQASGISFDRSGIVF